MQRTPLISTALLALALGCAWAGDVPATPTTFTWPDPASVTPANDQDAAAAVEAILAHPTTKRLLETDAQLTEAIPAFEAQTNVMVVVKREPLIQVLLTTWWHMVAIRAGASFPVVLVKQSNAVAANGYLSLALKTLPHVGMPSDIWAFPAKVDYRTIEMVMTSEEDTNQPTLAIVRQGKLLGLTPVQVKALSRPVVVQIDWMSSLHRVVDLTVDTLPLSEVAGTLSEMAKADLIMPVKPGAQPQVTIKVHGKTIDDILSGVADNTRWLYESSGADTSAQKARDLYEGKFVNISELYAPTAKSLWQAMVEPEAATAVGAQAMLDALRAKLPSVPVRPLITLRPIPTPMPTDK